MTAFRGGFYTIRSDQIERSSGPFSAGRVIPKLRHVLSCRGRLAVSLCNTVSDSSYIWPIGIVLVILPYATPHSICLKPSFHHSQWLKQSTITVPPVGPKMTRVDPWIPFPTITPLELTPHSTNFHVSPTKYEILSQPKRPLPYFLCILGSIHAPSFQ